MRTTTAQQDRISYLAALAAQLNGGEAVLLYGSTPVENGTTRYQFQSPGDLVVGADAAILYLEGFIREKEAAQKG